MPMPELWRQEFIDWRGPLAANTVYVALELSDIAVEQRIDRTPNGPRALVICGCAGAGKDYRIERMLKRRHLPVLHIDASSEAEFVRWCWLNRHAKVAIVKDNDKLLSHSSLVNRLKILIETGRVHYSPQYVLDNMKKPANEVELSLMVMGAQDAKEAERIKNLPLRDPLIPEPNFYTEFSIIWTSNIDFTDPKQIPAAVRTHWPALISRDINPRLIPDDPRDLFVFTLHLALECGMLRGFHLKLPDANEVLRVFIEHRAHLPDVSPRGLQKLALARQDLRQLNRLEFWDQQVKSKLPVKVLHPELASMAVPLFQIPAKV